MKIEMKVAHNKMSASKRVEVAEWKRGKRAHTND